MDARDWEIVRSAPLFGTMSQEAMERIISGQVARVYERGTLLFQQGTLADCFYVVLDGWVKIYRTSPGGEETVVNVFRRGETFAEAAMFMGGRYPVNAETVTRSRLLRADGEKFRRCIYHDPDLALSMLASVSKHLKSLVDQIEQIKRMGAPQRLADFLVRLCAPREDACVVALPYEKALIANRLGMKPESLSRALSRLRPLGVSVDRNEVSIEKVSRLIEFIESQSDDDAAR
jgi:CRP/FNR family transcriptional regulator, dissimilatory nitrate respiration regulator